MTIPLNPSFVLISFILVVILNIYIYRLSSKFFENQIKKLSPLLESPRRADKKFFVLPFYFEGYYNGRKITYTTGSFGSEVEDPMSFCIEPNTILIPQTFFRISSQKPTKNTKLKNKKIYFIENRFASRKYTEEDFKKILEELSLAAETVELGLPYFTK